MNRKSFLMGLVLGAASFSASAGGASKDWGYTGDKGPAAWGKNYPECSKGTQQSPIDIGDIKPSSSNEKSIEFHYQDGYYTAKTHGTVKYSLDKQNKMNYMVLNGKKYYLLQFHFHTPSEHQENGKSYPFEVHFVHQSDDGGYAVFGVFGVAGMEEDKVLAQVVNDAAKANKDDKFVIDVGQLLGSLSEGDIVPKGYNPASLPLSASMKNYPGSFTTPPCTEGVKWIVSQGKVELNQSTIDTLHNTIGLDHSNRPVQKLHGRHYTPLVQE